jgi:hypothetical protein
MRECLIADTSDRQFHEFSLRLAEISHHHFAVKDTVCVAFADRGAKAM